jgi:hypothetical protein
MLATLNSIAFHAGALRVDRRMDDPRLLRIRDAYMEPFAAGPPCGTTALGGAGPRYRDSGADLGKRPPGSAATGSRYGAGSWSY